VPCVGEKDLYVGDNLSLDDPDDGVLYGDGFCVAVGKEQVGAGLVPTRASPVADELQLRLCSLVVVDRRDRLWKRYWYINWLRVLLYVYWCRDIN
jgi:hypothetical protein